MSFLSQAINTKKQLDKNGRLMIFKKKTDLLSDSERPWGPAQNKEEELNTICVAVEYKTKEIDGEKIKSGDKKLLVNAIDHGDTPISDFEIVIDRGIEWRIKEVDTVDPGDVPILHKIQIRK